MWISVFAFSFLITMILTHSRTCLNCWIITQPFIHLQLSLVSIINGFKGCPVLQAMNHQQEPEIHFSNWHLTSRLPQQEPYCALQCGTQWKSVIALIMHLTSLSSDWGTRLPFCFAWSIIAMLRLRCGMYIRNVTNFPVWSCQTLVHFSSWFFLFRDRYKRGACCFFPDKSSEVTCGMI